MSKDRERTESDDRGYVLFSDALAQHEPFCAPMATMSVAPSAKPVVKAGPNMTRSVLRRRTYSIKLLRLLKQR